MAGEKLKLIAGTKSSNFQRHASFRSGNFSSHLATGALLSLKNSAFPNFIAENNDICCSIGGGNYWLRVPGLQGPLYTSPWDIEGKEFPQQGMRTVSSELVFWHNLEIVNVKLIFRHKSVVKIVLQYYTIEPR